ncbi:hypothetical protein HGM15179_017598 [Zosterops borbonicus]|uniref:Uncharacterized protein n=1 Tax=Zosterops borbonicus TaxID=364589 RepID=A0A8K1G0Q0_9PASS|nr:hypothetical protein HGM15179_017598 [Zosterops borbonicus]
MLKIKTLHSVIQCVLKKKKERKRSKTTASSSTQTIAEEKEAKSESTVSTSTQTNTKEKRTKGKTTVSSSTQTTKKKKEAKSEATVSTSTQTVAEEKEVKGAASISTQTVTELEPPKPVAVATTQKKKSKSKSVRVVTDEDAARPSQPAEETERKIIIRSLSLSELRDLQREFTRQTNKSILTWLLRIWNAAANDTILDKIKAKQLGSLSRDLVIDQGIKKTQEPLSLWQQLLTSVKNRYLCKKDLQVHQGK